MQVPQKVQYALRALFELSRRFGEGPVKVAEIAEAQAIPPRFLSVILGQLKQAGFVASHRGAEGGFRLVRPPQGLTVGDVLGYLQGPLELVDAARCPASDGDAIRADHALLPMWGRVQRAITDIFETTSFADLVEEAERARNYVPTYAI